MRLNEYILAGVLALSGCASAPPRPSVTYVRQASGLVVPDYPWRQARHQGIDLNAQSTFPPEVTVRGNIAYRGHTYHIMLDIADTNRDGRPDLVRATADATITRAPVPEMVGHHWHWSILAQDRNHDGTVDSAWFDDGADGTYEHGQASSASIDEFILHGQL